MPPPALILLAVVLLAWPASAQGWLRPVDAPVAGRFAYSPGRPFAAGQRRGVDFAAPRGAPVRAPCAGRVAYAGAVPGHGLGITLNCDRLTATVLGLAAVSVRQGTFAVPGQALGRASGGGPVRLGARVTGRRFAYVDPLALLREAPPRRPPAPLPGARRTPLAPPPTLVGRPATPSPHARGTPLTAWLGAALVAVVLASGIGLPRPRRRAALEPALEP